MVCLGQPRLADGRLSVLEQGQAANDLQDTETAARSSCILMVATMFGDFDAIKTPINAVAV
jgi:hypothetical protein